MFCCVYGAGQTTGFNFGIQRPVATVSSFQPEPQPVRSSGAAHKHAIFDKPVRHLHSEYAARHSEEKELDEQPVRASLTAGNADV